MANQKVSSKTAKELQEAILQEKIKGTPDLEIGQKYGVTFRYIEKIITKSQGLNVSALNVSKKDKNITTEGIFSGIDNSLEFQIKGRLGNP